MALPMRRPVPIAKRRMVSRTYSLPAPTGGLNAVNSLSAMPETDAIVMDNWFPQPSWVELRNGYTQWSTGYGAWVETLMGYSNASGEKLFAISGTSVYDATAGGAVGAAVVTGLTNARWEYTNVATAGGQYLYAGNATDAPLLYDGTTWTKITAVSTPAITGVTTTTLRNPVVWKNRVWFVEDGTMHGWYLPTASIGGAASKIDFGPLFRLGGKLQTIFTASLTDGSTFDNYLCVLSTEGEILLYRGTDPAQAGLFNMLGIYQVGKPVGRRCTFQLGTDTVIICSDGLASLSKLISVGRLNLEDTISYKILSLINTDIQSYKSNFGWQGVVHPLGNKVVVNVPQSENSVQYQYVMNTLNDSWCRFTGWNAACFCVLGNTIYFGGKTAVALCDTGQADNGATINGLLKTAYSYCKMDAQKQIKMVRPTLQTNGSVMAILGVNTDFNDVPPVSSPSIPGTNGSPWNTSPWNTSPWTRGFGITNGWQSASGVGFAFSTYISIVTNAVQVRLQSIDYLYEPGGVL